MSKLVDDIIKLEEIASRKSIKLVMTIRGPSRRIIQVYSLQPTSNQRKIIRNFMEVENAREAIRTRLQS